MTRLFNWWNRAIAVAFGLFILTGAVVTLLVAADALPPSFLPGGSGNPHTGAWFQPQLEGLAAFSGNELEATMSVAAIVALATLVLILLEIKPARNVNTLPISSTDEGWLTVEEDSVRHLAEQTGSSNRQIVSLRCQVRANGKRSVVPASIVIACHARVVLGSNVQDIRDDLQTRVKATVENLTGLNVLQVNVSKVKYDRVDRPRLIGA